MTIVSPNTEIKSSQKIQVYVNLIQQTIPGTQIVARLETSGRTSFIRKYTNQIDFRFAFSAWPFSRGILSAILRETSPPWFGFSHSLAWHCQNTDPWSIVFVPALSVCNSAAK